MNMGFLWASVPVEMLYDYNGYKNQDFYNLSLPTLSLISELLFDRKWLYFLFFLFCNCRQGETFKPPEGIAVGLLYHHYKSLLLEMLSEVFSQLNQKKKQHS